jgi:4-hydroxy-tetrahydrodipicolinate synthase
MELRGVIPVLLTPFTAEEGLDEAALCREIDFAIARGVAGLCAPAFGSEFYKLSDAERRRVAQLVIEQTRGRVPVFISTGSGSLRVTVEFSQFAESIGAGGVMVVPPQVVPLDVAALMRFYEGVCRSISLPVMLQDYDLNGGSGIPAGVLAALAERCANLEFVKLENPLSGEKCTEIARVAGGRLRILYGWGGLNLLDGLARGVCGVMPGAALADLYAEVFRRYDAGRVGEAESLFYEFQPFLTFGLQHLELFLAMEKRILVRRGIFPSARLREPTLRFDEIYEQQIEAQVARALQLVENLPSGATAAR